MRSSLERTQPQPKHGAEGARHSPIILGANRLTRRGGYAFRWLKNTSDASDQPLAAEEEQEESRLYHPMTARADGREDPTQPGR